VFVCAAGAATISTRIKAMPYKVPLESISAVSTTYGEDVPPLPAPTCLGSVPLRLVDSLFECGPWRCTESDLLGRGGYGRIYKCVSGCILPCCVKKGLMMNVCSSRAVLLAHAAVDALCTFCLRVAAQEYCGHCKLSSLTAVGHQADDKWSGD